MVMCRVIDTLGNYDKLCLSNEIGDFFLSDNYVSSPSNKVTIGIKVVYRKTLIIYGLIQDELNKPSTETYPVNEIIGEIDYQTFEISFDIITHRLVCNNNILYFDKGVLDYYPYNGEFDEYFLSIIETESLRGWRSFTPGYSPITGDELSCVVYKRV